MDFKDGMKNLFDIGNKIKPFGDRYNQMHDKEQMIIKTGIDCIDDAIIGIGDTDLFLIAAHTNVGKTEMGKIIACNCALQGYKSLLFVLESPDAEIENRFKWDMMMKLLYGDDNKYRIKIDCDKLQFGEWKLGQYYKNETILDLEAKAIVKLDDKIRNNLFVRYRFPNENYTVDVFSKEIDEINRNREFKVIIIDHLHYFSKIQDNENKEMEYIVKKLRDVALVNKIPIILFSHFKKKSESTKEVPDIDEIHGSSEIYKNATITTVLSKPSDIIGKEKHLYPTFMRVEKEKVKTGAARFAFCADYNMDTGVYEEGYHIYRLDAFGKPHIIENKKDFPKFAKRAREPEQIYYGSK